LKTLEDDSKGAVIRSDEVRHKRRKTVGLTWDGGPQEKE